MPTTDIYITLTVAKRTGQGKVDEQRAVSVKVPQNGTPGLTLSAANKTKLGEALEQLGALLDPAWVITDGASL